MLTEASKSFLCYIDLTLYTLRPSQLNYMLHGASFVKINSNKNPQPPTPYLIRLICDHNLPVWFGKPNNFSNSLKTPTLPSFLLGDSYFFFTGLAGL